MKTIYKVGFGVLIVLFLVGFTIAVTYTPTVTTTPAQDEVIITKAIEHGITDEQYIQKIVTEGISTKLEQESINDRMTVTDRLINGWDDLSSRQKAGIKKIIVLIETGNAQQQLELEQAINNIALGRSCQFWD